MAQKRFIDAQDFRGETLITYPVDRSHLDVFSQLLTPAKVAPAQLRPVELTAVILMLVASDRGVSLSPDWVVREVKYCSDYITRPLTEYGTTHTLFAATRCDDLDKPFIEDLIRLAGQEAKNLAIGMKR